MCQEQLIKYRIARRAKSKEDRFPKQTLEVTQKSDTNQPILLFDFVHTIYLLMAHHQKLWMTFVKTYALCLYSVEDSHL